MKKILTLILTIALVFSMGSAAFAGETSDESANLSSQADSITCKVAISLMGGFAKTKDGDNLAYLDVSVSDVNGNEKYDIDDVLYAAHEQFYEGGAEKGYLSEETQWGLSLKKMWGYAGADVNDAFGYYLNDSLAWGLTDEVKEGDFVYAYIYKDSTSWSDKYSSFETKEIIAESGETVTLKLRTSEPDENWNYSNLPYASAIITVNGIDVKGETNENGEIEFSLETPGTYLISSKASNDDILVPAVAVLTVEGTALDTVLNDTAKYVSENTEISNANEWRVMALSKAGLLSDEQKQEFFKSEEEKVKGSLKATSCETSIISLALTGNSVTDIAGKNLLDLLSEANGLDAINSQMYALIALDMHDFALSEEASAKLDKDEIIKSIIDAQKEDGGFSYSSEWPSDVDMTAMAIQALAPYKTSENVSESISKAKDFILNKLENDEITSAESFSQVLMALFALGSDEFDAGTLDKVTSGLLSYYNGDGRFCYNCEANEFSTTQSYYALVSLNSYLKDGTYLYSKTDHNKVTVKGKAATCTEDGLTNGEKCSICNEVYAEQEVIKATGHQVSGKAASGLCKCSNCGLIGYFSAGKLLTSKTGIVKGTLNGKTAWYYVKKGVYTKATGIVKKANGTDSNWYYVKNGVYKKTTVLAKKAGSSSSTKYYVKNGKFVKKTGLVKVNSKWYYVKKGKFVKKTGFFKKAGSKSSKKYYVKKGKFKKVTKTVKVNGKKYKVVKGVLKGRA